VSDADAAHRSDGSPEADSEKPLGDLVLRAREGDLEAAYEVLGRPLPVDTWVQVLRQLASKPTSVDLEVVAHRTLRRPTSVVVALLDLAKAVQSPVAAFLARAVAEVRTEERVRSEASALNAELVALYDVRELLDGDDAIGALYTLLAQPLAREERVTSELATDAAATKLLLHALRTEYERLQEVARDTRWRSGSYRHSLRHALADLALVAGIGGRVEEQAFRLLQLRTDEPEANKELLALVGADTRSRYLEWALERSSAESSSRRALFALKELERYPDAVERKTVERLLGSADSIVAGAAASYLVAQDPTDASHDREIAELLATGAEETVAGLVEAIAVRVRAVGRLVELASSNDGAALAR
jgi:hypothetical protein